ncbi:MAG: bifunctional adenosylcobinamide kinase/adenosylcobinamide-phosphate guanylyltransferase [Candidatus Omnitrophota bacterium]|nr:bifunctional adenosylcobinamide kinase/adenosylcobinamide-phosphate guanylyltransferase [Candidatus Omnitrophota bacterium]
MGKITFILGGARSGKSTYALLLAKRHKNVAFIATCKPLDTEMKKRIKMHREIRPKHWETFEEEKDISARLKKIGDKFECIVIDCLTLLASNLLCRKKSPAFIENKIKEMLLVIKKIKAKTIIVSNEVGLGIVPANKLARDFRDIAGRVNQITAQAAQEAYFLISGIPTRIKK